MTIRVGKAGLFSFIAGHTHEVVGPIESGAVDFDRDDPSRSHVRMVIAASGLQVTGKGEPRGDGPKVQAAMESDKVLDAARYPQIVFESAEVAVKNRRDAALDLTVSGQLTIRNVTQPVTVPVHASLTGKTMTVTGRFSIKQTAYGIAPITVGGVVSVKDALEVSFSILARR